MVSPDPRAIVAGALFTVAMGALSGALLAARRAEPSTLAPAAAIVVNTVIRRASPVAELEPSAPAAPLPSPETRPRTASRPPEAPPARAPAPLPAGGALVSLEGDALQVALLGENARYTLPGRVPPGTFQVLARFSETERQGAGQITLSSDQPITLRCEARFARCVRLP